MFSWTQHLCVFCSRCCHRVMCGNVKSGAASPTVRDEAKWEPTATPNYIAFTFFLWTSGVSQISTSSPFFFCCPSSKRFRPAEICGIDFRKKHVFTKKNRLIVSRIMCIYIYIFSYFLNGIFFLKKINILFKRLFSQHPHFLRKYSHSAELYFKPGMSDGTFPKSFTWPVHLVKSP